MTYVLDGQTAIGEASVTDSREDIYKLWHLRFRHLSERDLRELQK